MIRSAATSDLATLQQIESAAGEGFRAHGMDAVADDDPPSITDLASFVAAGNAWVDVEAGTIRGYLLALAIDAGLHIEQVTVHPDHAGRRIGSALIEHLREIARTRGVTCLTLTTFRDIPWNAPYYARLGFVVDDDPTPGLIAIRAQEARHGLDAWPRVVMRRPV